ncbi:putative GEM-like protein 8 [Dichanthelium oligosanthes]|uniref:Putative GEM-like protein 8 n=1 Tax=Dichanthelium oligosanthes TaxID=888268 RepID=A0A1E5VZM0_9POAL|nr:putative GEM-like protein 8 [Dichanthelium oligosanthes]
MEGSTTEGHVVGIPVSSRAYGIEEPEFPAEETTPDHGGFPSSFQSSYVTLGPKLSDTVKGKLTLGAKIIQAGGVEKVFRQWFSVDKNEKLLRASQCYLFTTAGPIAGMLFVSTARVAFRSDRSLAVPTPRGDKARVPYKVTIPLRKVKAVRPSENKHRPEQKYVQLVTNDDFEFWFMGFVSYNRSLQHLEQAVALKEIEFNSLVLTNSSLIQSGSKGQVIHWVNKLGRRAQSFRDHVTLGPKLSETVKGKLSLGARILQAGGVERAFRHAFSAEKGERLVKALQCYLYTTGGPIAGMLFVSTRRIAFRSDRSLAVTSPAGDVVARVPYKVVVPLRRIKRVRPSENADKPEQKYIQVATVDGFEFWFMGFVSYQRCCKYMLQVIPEL